MGTIMSGLVLRSGKFYVRKAVPTDLIKAYAPTREIKRSLRTSDRREAVKRSHAALAAIEAEFDKRRTEIRSAEAEADFLKSPAFLEERAKVFSLAARYGLPTVSHMPTVEELKAWIGKSADEISFDPEEISREDLDQLREMVDAEIKATGKDIRSSDHPRVEVIDGDVHTSIPPHLRERIAALTHKIVEDERASLVEDITNRSDGAKPSDYSLEVLKDGWIKERKVTSRTILEMNTAIRRFYETVGELSYTDITPEHCRSFRGSLIELNVKNATKKKQWSMLNILFGYAIDSNLIASNPFTALKMRLDNDSISRDVFPSSVLRQLFATIPRKSEEWWQCRIALYTGARLGEINQLTREDIIELDDVVAFRITDEGGKSVKTRSSIRTIPIHEQLIRDGFLDQLPPSGRLFSTSTPIASKRLNRRISNVAPSGMNLVFHSFRHTFKSACREVMGEDVHDRLTGHTDSHVGRRYGGHSIRSLSEALNRVRFGIETE